MPQANQPQLGFLGAITRVWVEASRHGRERVTGVGCPSAHGTPQRIGKHGDWLWGQTGLGLNLSPRVHVPLAKAPGHLQVLISSNFCGDENT